MTAAADLFLPVPAIEILRTPDASTPRAGADGASLDHVNEPIGGATDHDHSRNGPHDKKYGQVGSSSQPAHG